MGLKSLAARRAEDSLTGAPPSVFVLSTGYISGS
nr:MAG TPA: hypothetical protein [Caudoviricetes sp.]